MHSIQPSTLEIPAGKIETQFIFFYNIGALIQSDIIESKSNSYFIGRPIKGSELYTSAFFDNPIPTICTLHFHGNDDLIRDVNTEIKNLSARSNKEYEENAKRKIEDLQNKGYSEIEEYSRSEKIDIEIKKRKIEELQRKINNEITKINPKRNLDISLADNPCTILDPDKVQKERITKIGFAPLEFTLYKNGILVVIFRVKNNRAIFDDEYVELLTENANTSISNDASISDVDNAPYSMTEVVDGAMKVVGMHLPNFLNLYEIKVRPLSTGKERKIKFHVINESTKKTCEIEDLKNKCLDSDVPTADGDEYFHSCLTQPSRYIGTIIDLSCINTGRLNENKTKARNIREREMQLALACARITKQFLHNFNDPEQYLERELPRRNLYHPGPSIVFIARRGWSCIVREETRDAISFQLNVIEIALFVIESIIASTVYTRTFIKDVTKEGDEKGKELLRQLQDSETSFRRVSWHFVLRIINAKHSVKLRKILGLPYKNNRHEKINVDSIKEYTDFVSRIKLGLPYQNLEVLLSSHISTHTGIAAIRRLKYLTKHDELMLSARGLVENYNSFFTSIDQYWKSDVARSNKIIVIITIISGISGLIALEHINSLIGWLTSMLP